MEYAFYLTMAAIACNLSFILTEAQPFIIIILIKGRERIKERLQAMAAQEHDFVIQRSTA
ncbi:hypothetical protein HY839_03340 [Candidatus Azambacteria bacterium]|nr:hypothetical protein [Candidatus Azambacteria bacterium]